MDCLNKTFVHKETNMIENEDYAIAFEKSNY